MNKRSPAIVVAVVLAEYCIGAAQAAYIPDAITGATAHGTSTADTGAADLPTAYDDGAGNLYNIRTNPALAAVSGYGLTVDVNGNGIHSNKWQEDWQANISLADSNGTLTAPRNLYVDLGASHDCLRDLYVWNVREVADRGAKNVNIYYSDLVTPGDDLSVATNWTLLGSYVFSQATGAGTGVDNIVDLSTIPSARHFAFNILSNYGGTIRVGLGEVQFTIPEPSTFAMLLLVLGVMAMRRLRRRT